VDYSSDVSLIVRRVALGFEEIYNFAIDSAFNINSTVGGF
jgi:hypothetical protein